MPRLLFQLQILLCLVAKISFSVDIPGNRILQLIYRVTGYFADYALWLTSRHHFQMIVGQMCGLAVFYQTHSSDQSKGVLLSPLTLVT